MTGFRAYVMYVGYLLVLSLIILFVDSQKRVMML